MNEENKLNKEKAINLANIFLKRGIKNISTPSLHKCIQVIAIELGYIEGDPMRTNIFNLTSISDSDFIFVIEELWNFILKGYLAPGINGDNLWFPNVHLTEKGKEYIETIE